jgi:hypothetical protein
MSKVLFLSISAVFSALARGTVSNDDFCSALLFANHAKRILVSSDAELEMAAAMESLRFEEAMDVVRRAHTESRVGWAFERGGVTAQRTWRQLNSFLISHGLAEVDEEGQYTTSRAQGRIAQANPEIRVIA